MERVGGYELVRRLGQGAQATVWEARSPDGRRVALKRLHADRLLQDPTARGRLAREVELLRQLDHPGILRLLDAGEQEGVPWLVFPLLEGARPLDEAWSGRAPAERVRLVRDAARALGAMHARGICHRDVAPGNLLVDGEGRLRVGDLGMARGPEDAPLTATGEALGTPAWLAPEVGLHGSQAASPASDVWSLGVFLFQALTGVHPFQGLSFAAMLEQLRASGAPSPAAQRPGIGPALDQVCRRALAPRREERWKDGEAFAQALEAAVASAPPPSGSARLPSARAPAERALGAGARLGRWTLISLLGQGGMGSVFLAKDDSLGRQVALKVLPAGATEARRRRFLREMVAAGKVRHPAVCAVHEAGEERGHLFLVMDAIQGESLAERLQRGPLAQEAAARLVEELARGVQALHEAGVLHRDIKPGNVIVDGEGRPLLLDFGVALLDDMERLTRTGQAVGTPVYMAPEQLAGEEIDARADVHALGSILYETLTGFHAWGDAATPADLISAKGSAPTPAAERRPGIDPRLDAICRAALAPDRRDRPYAAGVLADALAAWREGRAIPTFGRRRAWPLILVPALALAALAAIRLGGEREPPLPERLQTWRVELDRQARRAPSLTAVRVPAELERGLAEGEGPDAEQVRAWLALLALARGDRAAAETARVGSAAGPPGELLRGGLLAAQDPSAALQHLEQAERAGLAPAELHAWRIEALLGRGVADREAGSAALAALARARAAGVEGEAALALEVAALFALDRSGEAAAGFARLREPPGALRWEMALGQVEEAFAARGPRAGLEALRGSGAARSPGPSRPRERRIAARLVGEQLMPVLRRWLTRNEGAPAEETDLVAAGFELHAALLPDPPAVEARLLVMQALDVAKMLPSEGAKELAAAASLAWTAEPELLLSCAELLRPAVHEERKHRPALLRITAAAVACTQGHWRYRARGFHAYALARSGKSAEALAEATALVQELGAWDAAALARSEASVGLAEAWLAGSIAARALRDLPRAIEMARGGLARGAAEANPGELHAALLTALMEAGRDEEALAEALAYAETGGAAGGIRKTVATLSWDILVKAGRWTEATRLAEHIVNDGLRGAGAWPARRAVARARSGDPARAADELAREGARLAIAPELLTAEALAALRRGDPAAIERLERSIPR